MIVGAGPAGLTAAYLLAKQRVRVTVLEADSIVGGLSRTEQYNGYRFDIGGHRFFTKIDPVQALWKELLGDEFISVPRLSRIYYNGRFFDYPLKAWNALSGLGAYETVRILASYVRARVAPSLRKRTSNNGSPTASATDSSASSSRPTPKRYGASRPRRSGPSGRRREFKGCHSGAPCAPLYLFSGAP